MELGPDGEFSYEEYPEKSKTGLSPEEVVSAKSMDSVAGRLKKAAVRVLMLLTALVLLAGVCAVGSLVVEIIQYPERIKAEFAMTFMSSESVEEGTFYIGQEGNPALFEVPEEIPWGTLSGIDSSRWHVEVVPLSPLRYQIRDCQFFILRPEASEIYVVTDFEDPTGIAVSMPQSNSGAVNICTSLSHIVEVVLWSN